jgi:O-antigen/teichoic acid export membrane protein
MAVYIVWIFSEKIINIFLTFYITVLLARNLGPDFYGILAFSLSLISLFEVVAHFGLVGLVVRELVKDPQNKNEILGTSFLIKFFISLVCFTLYLLFIFVERPKSEVQFLVSFILSFRILFIAFDVMTYWFQSRVESKYITISKVLGLVSKLVLVLYLVSVRAELHWYAGTYLIQTIIMTLVLVVLYQIVSKDSPFKWRVALGKIKTLISQSSLIFLGSMFSVIYLKIDQVMLKWLTTNEEVGIYAVAANLSEAWYFVPVAIVTTFFPNLIRIKQVDFLEYEKRLQKLFDFLFVLAFGASVVTTLFSDQIIHVFFGNEYLASSGILKIHIWASLFVFMRAAFSKWILIENVLLYSTFTHGFGAVVNIAINAYFIPLYGITGAALATVISYATASYFALFLNKRTRGIFCMMSKAMISPFRYGYVFFKKVC